MRSLGIILCASTFAALSTSAVHAQSLLSSDRFSLGVGAGSNGGVVEGTYQLNPQIVLRAQGAFIDFGHGFSSSDIKYNGELHFNTGGGFVDWHPFSNAWMVSGGAVDGQRKVDVTAKPAVSGSIVIHGVTYPFSEIGQVDGVIGFGNPAPVLAFGWDNTYSGAGKIGFRALLGVAFGDIPSVRLHAIGPYAENPAVLSDLAAEEVSLRHDAEDYRYYPLAQVGVTYRF